jgi:hypothetical protein
LLISFFSDRLSLLNLILLVGKMFVISLSLGCVLVGMLHSYIYLVDNGVWEPFSDSSGSVVWICIELIFKIVSSLKSWSN